MIYTVTFNPSLDYVVRVAKFLPGDLNRSEAEDLFVGGKGINVSVVLKRLGIESVALGFVAGFTGREIIHRLDEMGISSDLSL
jgi:1-phosphofructokinase